MPDLDLEIDLDQLLDRRLVAMASRIPAGDPPPALRDRRRRGRFALSLTMAPAILLLAAATATAGIAVVAGQLARGTPGIENPGQPLAGAGMECMTPRQAAAFLTAHGYTDVVWQVEAGSQAKGASTTTQLSVPPEHGYVVPGSVLGDGRLYMVIDQRAGAEGSGACFGDPMP